MFNRNEKFTGLGLTGLMILSMLMTIPLYVIMREMSDSLKEIAAKIAP